MDENNELPADFDEEFFREIHQKGGMMKHPLYRKTFSVSVQLALYNAVGQNTFIAAFSFVFLHEKINHIKRQRFVLLICLKALG